MVIIPVLDILHQRCVHAVGGHRDAYQPVQSVLAKTNKPLDLARGYRDQLGLNQLYVADLNAIQFGRPQLDVYKQLQNDGFELFIDAGLSDVENAEAIFGKFSIGAESLSIIVGLESVCGPNCLATIISRFGAENIIFSVDMFGGEPMVPRGRWSVSDFHNVVEAAYVVGARRFILLELSRVGTESGLPMMAECAQLREKHPEIELILGGGVRHVNDIRQAAGHGADGVLIATALHKGEITRKEIEIALEIQRKTQFVPEN
jgi:phosphoribosylformimino-5-aminoimidazole carboxamide ribotide isomerase